MDNKQVLQDQILKIFILKAMISLMGIYSAYQIWEVFLEGGELMHVIFYGATLPFLAKTSMFFKNILEETIQKYKESHKNGDENE